jgi:predicted transcriptional regulator
MITNIKQHAEYRSKDQLYFDILTAIKSYEPSGINKVKLQYVGRLSSDQLKMHSKGLLDAGLITLDTREGRPVIRRDYSRPWRRGDVFHLTDKGQKYLDMFRIQEEFGIYI